MIEAPTYFEYVDPVRHTRSQWIVERNDPYGRWSVRYAAENIHGYWTHFPSVPFDSKEHAVAYVHRMIGFHEENARMRTSWRAS